MVVDSADRILCDTPGVFDLLFWKSGIDKDVIGVEIAVGKAGFVKGCQQTPQVASEAEPVVTDAQRAELDRRLAATDAAPQNLIPWEEVKAKTLAKLRK